MSRTEVTVSSTGILTVTHDNRGYPLGDRAAAIVRWIAEHPTEVNSTDTLRIEIHCGDDSFRIQRTIRTQAIGY